MWKFIKILAIVILFILVFFAFTKTVQAKEYLSMIKESKGTVQLISNGETEKVKIGTKLEEGDIIVTGKKGYVTIIFRNGNIHSISPDSRYIIKEEQTKSNSLLDRLNSLRAKLSKGNNFSAENPTAVAGVRGADVYEQRKDAIKRELYWEN